LDRNETITMSEDDKDFESLVEPDLMQSSSTSTDMRRYVDLKPEKSHFQKPTYLT